MKREYKDKFKKKTGSDRRTPYTSTMALGLLESLDAIPGDRSDNIEKAVKSYYNIG